MVQKLKARQAVRSIAVDKDHAMTQTGRVESEIVATSLRALQCFRRLRHRCRVRQRRTVVNGQGVFEQDGRDVRRRVE